MTQATEKEVVVTLRNFERHPKAMAFIRSPIPRKVARAGRRGAKTVAVATLAVEQFLAGKRVLYGAPTAEQLETFWREVKRALGEAVDAGVYRKNETEHFIEVEGTENRLKAKTIYNADTARGDYADLLILDEWQLCNEDAWTEVGAPMLLDHAGGACFIYTPPSLRAGGISRATDPLHAAKLFKMAASDKTGRWGVFHWTSHDNPFISQEALGDILVDMSRESYRREIEAEDDDVSPNRLIYRAFNEDRQIIPPKVLGDSWPRDVGHDFGGANPAALFCAMEPGTGYLYAYKEYRPHDGPSIYSQVEVFKEWTRDFDVRKRIGGSHQEGGDRAAYSAFGWPIVEPSERNRGVNVRIDKVRDWMAGNKLFIFNTLHETMRELRTYLWKVDTDGVITNTIYNQHAFHLMDCLAYMVSDFSPERVAVRGEGARGAFSIATRF